MADPLGQRLVECVRQGKRCKNGEVEPPVHGDLVKRDFTAGDLKWLRINAITERHTGGALYLRGQGRLVQPGRRLFGQRPDEVVACRCGTRIRGHQA